MRVFIKGAGDLATGISLRLVGAGIKVVHSELAEPSAIRRTVCFSEAVKAGETCVEGQSACRVPLEASAIQKAWAEGLVPVVVDPKSELTSVMAFDAIVDARIAKRNLDTSIDEAPIVVALGPGFEAGRDCHCVVETMRGHDLGRLIWQGKAAANTGEPGLVGGETKKRLLRAPCDGALFGLVPLGAMVARGDIVALVGGQPMRSEIDGLLRGLLPDGFFAKQGMKAGDVDPRGTTDIYTVSDKARALGGAVLEALCRLGGVFHE